jgi:hypothetical protein
VQQGIAESVSRMMGIMVASGLFTSLVDIQQPDGNFGASGAPSNVWVDVSGLTAIPCMDAPLAPGTISALETKALEEIESEGIRHVVLNGYYPTIIAGWRNQWRAVIDSVDYEIFGAETDSQNTQTRLKLRLVTI